MFMDIRHSFELITSHCSLKTSVGADAANVKFEVADFFALETEPFDFVYDYTSVSLLRRLQYQSHPTY